MLLVDWSDLLNSEYKQQAIQQAIHASSSVCKSCSISIRNQSQGLQDTCSQCWTAKPYYDWKVSAVEIMLQVFRIQRLEIQITSHNPTSITTSSSGQLIISDVNVNPTSCNIPHGSTGTVIGISNAIKLNTRNRASTRINDSLFFNVR